MMQTNPLGMSDEDFLSLNNPSEIPTGAAVVDSAVTPPAVEGTVTEVETAAATTEVAAVVEPVAAATTEVEVVIPPVAASTSAMTEQDPNAVKVDPTGKTTPAAVATTEPEKKAGETTTATTTEVAPDYKGIVDKLMAPLQANGKTIEIKTPEEAIQLMQMGANYTKKMQAITPYRKVLTMLENNGLLDENKLSFLIDLDKKNPEAIKKLVKDAGIDPLDIDSAAKTTYLEGNHRVTDEEVGFKTAVDDLRSNPQGLATLQQINAWDQASKEVLWKQPEIMEVINSQRENGIYDTIQAEIDRRRILGAIPATTPFLTAYKIVGDEFAAAGKFVPKTAPVAAVVTPVTPIATRVGTPKPAAVNGDKVSAASSTRSTPGKAQTFVNPLSLSDDEFLKQFAGRV